jgi:hypothetical protein
MEAVPPGLLHLLWILPLILLILFLSSPRFRGDIAASRVRRLLAQGLESRHYTVFNRIRLPAGGGSVTIDHLVVSKFGVFVIASHHARGNVAGGEYQDRWRQQFLGRTTLFENPLHQCRLQAEAVQRLLEIPQNRVKSLLVLGGHASFRGGLHSGMATPERMIAQLRKYADHCLDEGQVRAILARLRESELPERGGFFVDHGAVLRWFLFALLVMGAWFAFRDDLASLVRQAPVETKTGQERWEDSLICAWSEDTGRCACYSSTGERQQMAQADCRRLAEKGSILKR